MSAITINQHMQIARTRNFWIVAAVFILCIIMLYPQFITGSPASLLSFMGLSRHTVERIILLFPVVYSAFIFGTATGIASLVVAAVIMLPQVFLFSTNMPDALSESLMVILVGAVMITWFDTYRKEKEQYRQMLSKLEQADLKLHQVYKVTRNNEERLWALNKVAAILSQSLELEDILRSAASSIKQVMNLDVVLVLLADDIGKGYDVITNVGIDKQYTPALEELNVKEGFIYRTMQEGETQTIQNISSETGPVSDILKKDGIVTEIVVPIKTKGELVGALVGAMREDRTFLPEETDLLATFGNQIGMAIDNSRCYLRECTSAEQAIISEKRARDIFENAHDSIWIHDMDGYIISANKSAEEWTGYSLNKPRDGHRVNVKDFLTEESLAMANNVRQKLLAGEKVEQPYEQHLIKSDGSDAIVKLSTTVIMEEGKPKGFQNICRDVTREKEMQDKLRAAYQELSESHRQLKESQQQLIQAEKLISMGQLAASIAHEVNNPLSGILTYAQLLQKKIKTGNYEQENALNYLGKMETELIRSTKLIRNLLDFARQSPPAFRQVNLNEIVNRAFDLTAHSAQMQHVKVNKELDPELPAIMADFDQLQQVATNLFLNAIQAMPGGGDLNIRTFVENGQVKLEVKDTGVGISEANMQKLFTPFFTTKREVKGVGLGLAVAYGIIQRHKGKIEVKSKEGEGAAFTICLPLNGETEQKNS